MLKYRDLSLNVCEASWDDVFTSARRIQEFFAAVRMRFVERDDLVRKIKYAFMMREHVMVDGPTGAGKSALFDTILDNIEGANVWSMDLTKFTGTTDIFGAFDVKKMREEGPLVHMTEGSLLEANFAKGGEFLDANDPLLRSMLGATNERRVKRGAITYRVPLVSFVADTNFRIDDMPGRRQQLAAVLDRFLFQVTVNYVEDERNRYSMLEMFLEGASRGGLPPLTLDDVVRVSGVILENDLVTDRYVREAYQQMTYAYSKARVAAGRAPLSDRRYLKAAHIMEVGAILHGRPVCTFDDLQYTGHVLIQHPDDAALFETAKNAAIDHWAKAAERREIDMEKTKLQQITSQIPTLDASKLSFADLQVFVTKLNEALDALKGFEPHSIEIRASHAKAIASIHHRIAELDEFVIARLAESIPNLPENIPLDSILPLKQSCTAIEDELRKITPKSDKARADLAIALERVGHNIATLQVEFETAGRVRR